MRIRELIGDGVLVATPAGSAAYNLSAYGPILPIDAPLLALTPIAPFRPRRWRGVLVPDHASVQLRVLQPDLRPASITADFVEVRGIGEVTIRLDRDCRAELLLDADHGLGERILREQFSD